MYTNTRTDDCVFDGVLLSLSDEFRSKVSCENDVIQLVCNPYSRIAVYSASYGRTEYESIQCAQPLGVKEESEWTSQIHQAPALIFEIFFIPTSRAEVEIETHGISGR